MRNFATVFVALAALIAGSISMPAVVGTSLDQHSCKGHVCTGKETPPLDIAISVPQNQIYPGSAVGVQVSVTALDDIRDLRLQVLSEGGASVLGPAQHIAGDFALGEKHEFEVTIAYNAEANSAFEISAQASTPQGYEFGRREGFYTVYRNGRPYHGRDGLVSLEHRAVRDEFDLGLITQEEFDVEMARQLEAEGFHSDTPMAPPTTAPLMAITNKLEPRHPEGFIPQEQQIFTNAVGNITVRGTILFTDRNGTTHGAYGVQVEVWDDDLIIDDLLADDVVGSDGAYEFVIANDNSVLENGYDVYVKFRTVNEAVDVQDGGNTYDNQSGISNNVSDGATLTRNFTYANTGDGAAGSVHVGASYIAGYVKFQLNGGTALGQKPVNWPAGGAFYNGSSINIRQGDRFDWDVLHHEYGHYVMDAFNFENNPGGSHSSSSCATDVRPNKSEGLRLAWGESWPTYFAASGQILFGLGGLGITNVGDTRYDDTEESTFGYDLEDESADNLVGEGNERANMRVLWDLWDSASDGPDNSSYTAKSLFDVFDAGGPTTTSSAWADLRGSSLVNTNQLDLAVGALSSAHGWGPLLISPAAGNTVSPSSKTFSWNNGVNCGTFDGNQWDLVFYNPATYAKILTIAGLNSATKSLSNAELSTLIAGSNNHEVLWAVEGYNTSSPATGPFLGENFSIFVNTPPVADAGDDIVAECTSHTVTTVGLDGSGSSDADGDVLTYSWAHPDYFLDATVVNPTGEFTLGEHTLTLTVSDGLDTDSDQVKVTIVDTTEPEVTCAGSITIECTSYCGTPFDNEQLTDFFAAFSATDVCDADPDTTFTHPTCFPLGTSPVVFAAVDGSGNSAACTSYVTVEDTTPPEIDVVLDRKSLWPPNHKMADICATVTVTDICDPNPTFVLTDVSSSEPDNGKGDGNTVNDIQGAVEDSPDVKFQLRSERSGRGDGRKYTIIYTAMDMSMNTASDTVCVVVPHDQSGNALASMGFNPYGNNIEPGADTYVIVIPSRPDDNYDATAIDPTWALVGNTQGVVKPSNSTALDVDEDGAKDMVLYYSAPETMDLFAGALISTGKLGLDATHDLIGLHYWDTDGTTRLVPSIFALGEPVVLPRTDSKPDRDEGTGEPMPIASEPQIIETPRATGVNSIYPNPFNPTTTVSFDLETAQHVSIRVYDTRGHLVRTLRNEVMSNGTHQVLWDARDNAGNTLATGIYFLHFQAGSYETTRKLVLLK
jgi:hypothetical protein